MKILHENQLLCKNVNILQKAGQNQNMSSATMKLKIRDGEKANTGVYPLNDLYVLKIYQVECVWQGTNISR